MSEEFADLCLIGREGLSMLEEGNSERARGPEGRFLCWSALVPDPTRRDGWLWCLTLSRVVTWDEEVAISTCWSVGAGEHHFLLGCMASSW